MSERDEVIRASEFEPLEWWELRRINSREHINDDPFDEYMPKAQCRICGRIVEEEVPLEFGWAHKECKEGKNA